MRTIIICVLCYFMSGCVKIGQSEFITVCMDHVGLVNTTNDALMQSISDKILEIRSHDPVNKDEIEAMHDLMYRLQLIKDQAIVINNYVNTTQVTKELIAEMIRQRWARPSLSK